MPGAVGVAGGVGASLTLAGTKAVRIGLFAFAFDSPDAAGVLIGLELFLAKAKEPIAFGALEWHPDTDKWGLTIGLNLSLRVLLGDDAPKWIVERGIGASLTGLFYTGNQPDTLAIGQYNDVATWLARHWPWALDVPPSGASFLTDARAGRKKVDDLYYKVTVANLRGNIARAGFTILREDLYVSGTVRRWLPPLAARVPALPVVRDVLIGNMEYLLEP